MPGAPPSAGTASPLSSASAERPERTAASRALICALSTNVEPVSSGSGRASSLDAFTATDHGRNRSRISATLRSEEHTSELQSLMRISYAVFCLKQHKKQKTTIKNLLMNN